MRRLLLSLSLCSFLAACGGGEHSDVKQWMAEAAKDMRGRVPPLPEVKPFPVVSYEAADLVDPFRPSKIEPDKSAGVASPKAPQPLDPNVHPLIKYPLESLRFVGLLRNAKITQAVILADKRAYQVKIGNYLGQNYGMITDIKASPALDEARLILRELVQDAAGEWVERTAIVELQQQEAKK